MVARNLVCTARMGMAFSLPLRFTVQRGGRGRGPGSKRMGGKLMLINNLYVEPRRRREVGHDDSLGPTTNRGSGRDDRRVPGLRA